jgi:glutathione S-transferase
MKLFEGPGLNSKIVRMFMAEKKITMPLVAVDIMKNENRSRAHLERNPSGTVPVLALDDGTYLSEVTAICDYLEELNPEPPLIGATPEERAQTRMWVRKIDLNISEPMANSFRFGEALAFFQDRVHCEPEIAEGLKRIAAKNLSWLDTQLAGRKWIVGDRFTLADIFSFGVMSFFAENGRPLDPLLRNLTAWFDRTRGRPSARA